MAAAEFILFPGLPLELRRLIWKFALPVNHVLELDAPYGPLLFSFCDLRHASRANTRPPTIAWVCSESRQVASDEGGCLEGFQDVPALGTFNAISKPWLHSRSDIVHLNWYPDYSARSAVENEPSPVPSLVACARRGGRASIMANLVVPWDACQLPVGHYGRYRRPQSENLRLLASLGEKECTICLRVVSIHVSAEDAVRSGLFGAAGLDTPVRIVDASDSETVERMRQLWMRGPIGKGQWPRDVESRAAFGVILDSSFQLKLEGWSAAVTTVWLSHKYMEEWDAGELRNVDDPDQIWTPPGGPESLERQWHPAHPKARFNEFHPWVKATTKAMPKFKPAIMFRYCANICYPTGPPVPNPIPGFPPSLGPAFIPLAVPGYADDIPHRGGEG